jgi:hypothetical protein
VISTIFPQYLVILVSTKVTQKLVVPRVLVRLWKFEKKYPASMAYKKRNRYSFNRAVRSRGNAGKDQKIHAVTTQAESLFHAAEPGLAEWSKMWWYDPAAVVTVKSSDEVWR